MREWTVGEFYGSYYLVSPDGVVCGGPYSKRAATRSAESQNLYEENRRKNAHKIERERAAREAIRRFFLEHGLD